MTRRTFNRLSESLRYFLVGVITMMQTVDFMSEKVIHISTFVMGVLILALKSADRKEVKPKETV